MERGWFCFWRAWVDDGLIRNHNAFILWVYILRRAAFKQHTIQIGDERRGFQDVILMPGQCIIGRRQAAKDLRMSQREYRTALSWLQKLGKVTIRSTKRFTLVSVVNWETYQFKPEEIDQEGDPQSDQEVTKRRPRGDHEEQGLERKEGSTMTQVQETQAAGGAPSGARASAAPEPETKTLPEERPVGWTPAPEVQKVYDHFTKFVTHKTGKAPIDIFPGRWDFPLKAMLKVYGLDSMLHKVTTWFDSVKLSPDYEGDGQYSFGRFMKEMRGKENQSQ